MSVREIETDYLIVGGGASAMAYVDALLEVSPSSNASWSIVVTLPGGTGWTHTRSSVCTSRRPTTA